MGDWNRPRHLVLVLAVSSKIKVMCHSCIFIVFLIQCIPSHLQHNMRGVYVLAKHSSYESAFHFCTYVFALIFDSFLLASCNLIPKLKSSKWSQIQSHFALNLVTP